VANQRQITEAEAKELKVLNVACKAQFTFFTRFFFNAQYKRKWVKWEHLYIIAEALEKVIRGDIKRLIINIAPRYGKTELAVKMFIAYGLALNPSSKYIHLSYSDDLALDNSEAVRDLVTSDEYQSIFPSVSLKQSSRGKKKWYTDAQGGIYATSTGGQITGFGAGITDEETEEIGQMIADISEIFAAKDIFDYAKLWGGCIIIDDANKPDDADSELVRNRVNERYDSTISNRVNSRDTPIILIQQRVHEEDLSGYLIRKQPDTWTVLSLPSIKEDGTALCPQKHTIEELLALQKHNDLVFQRQHMQNPKPKAGLLFPIDDLHFYDPEDIILQVKLSDPDYTAAFADPANEGGDDFASGGFKLIANKIYVTDILYNTEGADFNEQELVKLVLKVKAKTTGVEAVLGWKETAERVRTELESKGYDNEFRLLRPRKSKHSRILNRASFIRNHFVFRSDWDTLPQYAKFMRNLTSYLKIQETGLGNKRDDAPDLCEMAGSYFEKNFAHLYPINN
jgi:hypothetical protein